MAWLEAHQQLERHPKTQLLMGEMGWGVDEAIGKLMRFWWWCLDFAPTGDLRKFNDTVLAGSVGLSADSSAKFVHAMVKARWLDRGNGVFRVHDWPHYAGRYLKDSRFKRQPQKWQEVVSLYEMECAPADDGPPVDCPRTVGGLSPLPNQPTEPNLPPKPPRSKKDRTPTTETAQRIARLFNRRLTTAWSEKEVRAFKALGEIAADDLDAVERYYAQERAKGPEAGRHRRDLLTFLNNFPGEVDRARAKSPRPCAAPVSPIDLMRKRALELPNGAEDFKAWMWAEYGDRAEGNDNLKTTNKDGCIADFLRSKGQRV